MPIVIFLKMKKRFFERFKGITQGLLFGEKQRQRFIYKQKTWQIRKAQSTDEKGTLGIHNADKKLIQSNIKN